MNKDKSIHDLKDKIRHLEEQEQIRAANEEIELYKDLDCVADLYETLESGWYEKDEKKIHYVLKLLNAWGAEINKKLKNG
jgi:hypothetical protein